MAVELFNTSLQQSVQLMLRVDISILSHLSPILLQSDFETIIPILMHTQSVPVEIAKRAVNNTITTDQHNDVIQLSEETKRHCRLFQAETEAETTIIVVSNKDK